MSKFVGTKLINAEPMTRADYNTLRGWLVPADEDGTDEGYLVEYIDGGQANVEGYAGYVSWSPKAVFEAAYIQVDDAVKVLPSRIEELMSKLEYRFARVEGTTITGCWAQLPGGFSVGYGESACVDPTNFNKEDGEKYAKERCVVDARNKLWMLEGYVLALASSRV